MQQFAAFLVVTSAILVPAKADAGVRGKTYTQVRPDFACVTFQANGEFHWRSVDTGRDLVGTWGELDLIAVSFFAVEMEWLDHTFQFRGIAVGAFAIGFVTPAGQVGGFYLALHAPPFTC